MVEVSIVNWDKYHPKDMQVKTPFWFRLNRDINTSTSLWGLTPSQKWVWICLLCLACTKGTGKLEFDLKWAELFWGVPGKEIIETIKMLTQNGATTHSVGSDLALSPPQTNKQTNNLLVSDETDTVFSFEEELQNKYPKRNGSLNKAAAVRILKRKIKTKEEYDLFLTALANYRLWCDREKKTGTQYVLQISTWVNNWQEWLELPDGKNKKSKVVVWS